ncbi:MAG: sigma-70 family RNA polymerase sigma factor [Actinomycetota bacterium]|nr:sigma-70 family RNA polymerase sigma factor [Actinomycetota bacterium]
MPRTDPEDDDCGRGWLDDIYAGHRAEIFGFCRRLTGDQGLAEEITQDVFVRAWRAKAQFDHRLGSLRTWLFGIARNAAIDAHRARSVRPALAARRTQSPDGPAGDTAADTVDGLADRWAMEDALGRLSDEHRVALVAVHLEGRAYAEVAEQLGVPVGTVKSRVFHGLHRLREIVEADQLFGRWSS